ncbi:AraC family transcriptional regulator N-terminal domain-containing protein [Pantoea sp. NSTU24]|uniref:AraC family transcriptional regulator n=1 Tax=Pantoea sp. NSTU24 TaxID=3391144 RepID=UPI003CFE876A
MSDMITRIKALAEHEGYNLTTLPDVRILRADRPLEKTPVLYDSGIVFVCQGSKRGYFGQKTYLYDEQHYLAVSVPVPFTMETDASEAHPLLAIYIHLDLRLAAELMIEIDQLGAPYADDAPQSMMSSQMNEEVKAAVVRLLEVLDNPAEAAILGRGRLRELYYRVLTGAQGNAMRAALSLQGHFGKIGKALQHIHAHYAEPLTLGQLAKETGMSVPTFHLHFRAVTQLAPMQYVKSVRLHQGRMLMVRQQLTAAAAGYAVGYESPSQFSREFKRLFGLPPAEEIRRMQRHFTFPAAPAGSDYISSH